MNAPQMHNFNLSKKGGQEYRGAMNKSSDALCWGETG